MRLSTLCLLAVAVSLETTTSGSKNCLALIDSKSTSDFEKSFSKFISAVSSNCDRVDIKSLKDKAVVLKKFGEFVYSDVFLGITDPSKFKFPTDSAADSFEVTDKYRQTTAELHAAMKAGIRSSDEESSGLAVEDFLDFVDNGNNLMISVQGKNEGGKTSKSLTRFLAEFAMGIDSSSFIVDFFDSEKSDDLITSSPPLGTEPWTSMVSGKQTVIFRGSPISMDKSNLNVYPILRASETATHASGQGLSLVLGAAHQTLNGARAVLLGSMDMLSDEFFGKNADTINHILSWTFGNRGLIRIRDFFHHRVGEAEHPRMYREKDEVVVGGKFEELVGRNKWVPYTAGDVQIEYVMLDPHVRDFLKYNSAKKQHELFFKVPDVYGIFKFKIVYNRLGYNPIKFEQVAPVRNYRHNDYERFLFCAYPYYASAFLSLVMVSVVSVLFLNHKEKGAGGRKEKRHRE